MRMTNPPPFDDARPPRSPAKCVLPAIFLMAFAAAPAPADDVVTHLFTSWYGVEPGKTVFEVNRQDIYPEYEELIEQVKDYYQIVVTNGKTAPVRVSVPVGVRLLAEVATKTEPWLLPEKPWESGGVDVQHVIQDNGLYRVWYSATDQPVAKWKVLVLPNGRKKMQSDIQPGYFSGTCYMESRDGVHWTRPSLGLQEYKGSKDNNIIPDSWPAIFIDRLAPPEERYKAVSNRSMSEYYPDIKQDGPALGAAVSPDGIHWKRLAKPISDWRGEVAAALARDGSPEVHRDETTGDYVLFTRANYPRRRSIAWARTSDFRTWPVPSVVLTPGPDEDPSVDFYDNPYLFVPGSASSHLMLVSSFHRDTSRIDIRMGSSMDGDAWNWLSPRTVVELGQVGQWDGGMIFAYGDMVRLPDGRLAVAITGYSDRHEEDYRNRFERSHPRNTMRTAWAIWEDGRLAGVEAEKAGEFTTLPLKATGRPIEINARAGGSGSIQVDVMVDGRPFPEVMLTARQMTGDVLWQPLEFEKGSLAELSGRTIRLRFRLYDAKVFGFRGQGLEWVSPYSRK